MVIKKCRGCGETFRWHPNRIWCGPCKKELVDRYQREHRKRNAGLLRIKGINYYYANHARALAYHTDYRAKNREAIAAKAKARRDARRRAAEHPCPVCGVWVELPKVGGRRVYCSRRCQTRAQPKREPTPAQLERRRVLQRKRYAANREKYRAQMRERYWKNPDYFRKRAAQWCKENPQRHAATVRKNRRERNQRKLETECSLLSVHLGHLLPKT